MHLESCNALVVMYTHLVWGQLYWDNYR